MYINGQENFAEQSASPFGCSAVLREGRKPWKSLGTAHAFLCKRDDLHIIDIPTQSILEKTCIALSSAHSGKLAKEYRPCLHHTHVS